MSNIVDKVLADVCLDERITDGIFKMDEEQHMDALRDYFVRRGLTRENAASITNRMLEGKYPDRQAWRVEDGILVTWPSPQHKKKAMQENPGKYTEQQPKKPTPEPPEPKEPEPREPVEPKKKEDDEKPSEPKGAPVFPKGGSAGTSGGGTGGLEIEPPRGDQKPEPPPAPAAPIEPQAPKTPERIAAEKEVANQIIKTDDSALTKIEPPMTTECQQQLTELLKYADKIGYNEAVRFLINHVKI